MAKLGFVFNLETCSDHRGCMVACKRERKTAPGVRYIETFTAKDDGFPDNKTYFIPVMCQHCENPTCVPTCTHNVFSKRDDGVVLVGDTFVCKTCIDKPCIQACPYEAIKLDIETGRVGKCDMCADRLAQGQPPACIPNCFCGAISFGDFDDPESPVSQMKAMFDSAGLPLHQLRYETGNDPHVYYALGSKPWRDMDNLYSSAWRDES